MKYKNTYHQRLMDEADRISRNGEVWWIKKHIVNAAKYDSQINALANRKKGNKKRIHQNAL